MLKSHHLKYTADTILRVTIYGDFCYYLTNIIQFVFLRFNLIICETTVYT